MELESSSNNVLFFVQANADIAHVLKEIEIICSENKQVKVKVICLVPSIFKCFLCLEVPESVTVSYCKRFYPPLKKPWRKRVWRHLVEKMLNKMADNKQYDRVYFTSANDDPVTPYYLCYFINRGSKAFYLNHYDNVQAITPCNKIHIKEKIILLLTQYFTGLHFTMCRMGGRWNLMHFHYEDYPINELHPVLDKKICKKYSYKTNVLSNNTVLVFSQPNRDHDLISDIEYDILFKTLIDKLKVKGYYVVIKGHPKYGICPSNAGQADEEIPKFISSEFINLDLFKACYGFMTIALSSAAKLGVPSYSIMSLMSETHSQNYLDCLKFTNESSDGKIKLLNSWNDI